MEDNLKKNLCFEVVYSSERHRIINRKAECMWGGGAGEWRMTDFSQDLGSSDQRILHRRPVSITSFHLKENIPDSGEKCADTQRHKVTWYGTVHLALMVVETV